MLVLFVNCVFCFSLNNEKLLFYVYRMVASLCLICHRMCTGCLGLCIRPLYPQLKNGKNILYVLVSVLVCACSCVRARVRVCVCERVVCGVGVYMLYIIYVKYI